MHYPDHLLKLIALFKKFPGVGSKSAERFAFHLLDWSEEKLREMGQTIEETRKNLKNCDECGCLMERDQCPFCSNSRRNPEIVCVVASPKDVYLIEQTHEFNGLYHVLGGLLSPLQGLAPAPRSIEKLKERVKKLGVREMIF